MQSHISDGQHFTLEKPNFSFLLHTEKKVTTVYKKETIVWLFRFMKIHSTAAILRDTRMETGANWIRMGTVYHGIHIMQTRSTVRVLLDGMLVVVMMHAVCSQGELQV